MEDHDQQQRRETLVVAARTAEHPRLAGALRRHAREQPTTFTLLVPALPAGEGGGAVDLAGGWLAALECAERAARELREAGLDLREAIVGDADCAAALGDATHAREFDEILLATVRPREGAPLAPVLGGRGPAPATETANDEPQLELQRIANTSLRFRSSRLGAFLRDRRGAGVILDSRKTSSRWRDDAGKRNRARSGRAPAVAGRRSSS